MRRIFAVSLLFLSPLALTAAAEANSANDAPAPTQVLRVSTGVIAPQLVHSTNMEIPPTAAAETIPAAAQVVLSLNVDEQGQSRDVHVVKSLNPEMDARVVAAVRQFRWHPATLDKQAIPVDLNLIVVVQH